jgi:uncharacterized membrane protein
MNPTEVLVLAFLIGGVAGLRSMTAPAVLAWAAHLNWLDLHNTRLSFMGSIAAVAIFTLLAIIELIADKLPSTPSRLEPAGLIARIMLGALGGAGIALAAGTQSLAVGGALGAIGGIAGAFAGHATRTRLVKALKVPDIYIALLGDAIAIGGGLLIVSRF